MKDKYATKVELKEQKDDQTKSNERLEGKMDKIIGLLLEGRHEG